MKKLSYLLAAILMLGTTASYAECSKPDEPAYPDGATATEAQMLEGQSGIKAYMDAANAFLECLNKEEAAIPATEPVELKEAIVQRYNETVGEMEKVAEGFNLEIRAWKAQGAR